MLGSFLSLIEYKLAMSIVPASRTVQMAVMDAQIHFAPAQMRRKTMMITSNVSVNLHKDLINVLKNVPRTKNVSTSA